MRAWTKWRTTKKLPTRSHGTYFTNAPKCVRQCMALLTNAEYNKKIYINKLVNRFVGMNDWIYCINPLLCQSLRDTPARTCACAYQNSTYLCQICRPQTGQRATHDKGHSFIQSWCEFECVCVCLWICMCYETFEMRYLHLGSPRHCWPG